VKKTSTLLFIFLLFVFNSIVAQTEFERKKISSTYNQLQLKQLSQDFANSYENDLKEARSYAAKNNIPLQFATNNGGTAKLQKVLRDGTLLYIQTDNRDGGLTVNADALYTGGNLDLQVEGEGIIIGVWDGGRVRSSHELLEERVTQIDEYQNINNHATHVTGTIIGSDIPEAGNARGMAFKATVLASYFENDLAKMTEQASQGLLISNHSYGFNADNLPNYYFGRYDQSARALDNLLFNTPYYTVVVSAGNDRGSNLNIADAGYDILTDYAVAKNNITVAAVNGVADYSGPFSVVMSNFSSFGPTDDMRIKPDISAKGVNMLSSVASSDTAYSSFSGTSMSAPNVTGALALLQELHNDLYGDFMLAASLKALAIHTAEETGFNPGPDPEFGWGLLNVERGAEVILNEDFQSVIEENNLVNGSTYTKTVTALGTEPLRATIVWTDPSGALQGVLEDDPKQRLVNDLDIIVTDSNGTITYPWKLDPSSFTAAAIRGVNSADNVEKIEVDLPLAGIYTITVNHKEALTNGSQNFSLIVTGIDEFDFAYTPDAITTEVCDNEIATFNFNYVSNASYNGPTELTVSGLPSGAVATFTPSTITTDQDFQLQISGLENIPLGEHTFTVNASGSGGTKTKELELVVNSSASISSVTLNTPINGETNVYIYPTLDWSNVANASNYTIEVSEDVDFSTLTFQATTDQTNISIDNLAPDTQYFWRVKPYSFCEEGSFAARNFTTETLNCFTSVAATDVPSAIPTEGEVTSVINITNDFTVGDVNVFVELTHSYLVELTVSLTSPSGTEVLLFGSVCGDFNNTDVTFDDASSVDEIICSSFFGITGTMQPQGQLSDFIGENSVGNWTLKVVDSVINDGGTLDNVDLIFCESVVGPNLGTVDYTLEDFMLYPNPAKGSFNFSLSNQREAINLGIYDNNGRRLINKQFDVNSDKTVNIESLSSGMYFIEITDGARRSVKKLIVQ
jgi:subtilisin-like proprotein convertase family protein/subtilisin family serine protease